MEKKDLKSDKRNETTSISSIYPHRCIPKTNPRYTIGLFTNGCYVNQKGFTQGKILSSITDYVNLKH